MRVVPTTSGRDLDSTDRKYDAHVRLEVPPGENRKVIAVDIFNATKKDSSEAHVESEYFPLGVRGVRDATDFLKGYGFDADVRLPKK